MYDIMTSSAFSILLFIVSSRLGITSSSLIFLRAAAFTVSLDALRIFKAHTEDPLSEEYIRESIFLSLFLQMVGLSIVSTYMIFENFLLGIIIEVAMFIFLTKVRPLGMFTSIMKEINIFNKDLANLNRHKSD